MNEKKGLNINTYGCLTGEAAKEFDYMMKHPDIEAIKRGEKFISSAPKSKMKDSVLTAMIPDLIDKRKEEIKKRRDNE